MEKFAVVLNPDNGQRIINKHPVLRRLPEKVARKCMPLLSTQKAGLILDTDNHENLGCLIDVPGFFANWANLEDEKRYKTLTGIIRTLNKIKTSVLCFPWLHYYFTDDEIVFLENEGITLLDGFYHRLAGMLLVLKQLFAIIAIDVPGFEVGIWGADTDVGQVWVEAMAGYVNNMCIGGLNFSALEELADNILATTGLACQITNKPEVCLSNKNITVVTRPIKESFPNKQPSFNFESIRRIGNYLRHDEASKKILGYNIKLAWMAPPQDVGILEKLNPWEELGVLDGLFYAVSRVYREEIRYSRITLEQMNRLHALYELYPIKVQGFIHQGRRIHFDRFRREYFR